MVGLISGPLPNALSDQALGRQAFESTTGEVLGARFDSAFSHNPTLAGMDAATRDTTSLEAVQNTGGPARDPRNAGSDVDAMAAERGDGPDLTPVDAAEAKKRAAAAGVSVPFDKTLSSHTVDAIIADHKQEQDRQDIIERRAGGILTGGVARFSTDLLAGLMDPLNIASGFIPVVPEAFTAARMAQFGASLGGRMAVRAGVGAAEGAVGQAMLEPLNAGIALSAYNDYTAGDALRNIALGAAIGSGLHSAIHAPTAIREARMGAFKAALAQTVEGRPVDVAPIIAHAEATHAADTLSLPARAEAELAIPLEQAKVEQAQRATLLQDPAKIEAAAAQHGVTPEEARAMLAEDHAQVSEQVARAEGKPSEIPPWMQENAADTLAFAEKANLVEPVRQMAEQGMTAREISVALKGALDAGEVRLVRDSLGIAPAGPLVGPGGAIIPREQAAAGLRAEANAQAQEAARKALQPHVDPAAAKAEKINRAAVEASPVPDGPLEKQLAEATKLHQEVHQQFQAEVAAGRLNETAELTAALDVAKQIEGDAKAAEAAASCIATRGF